MQQVFFLILKSAYLECAKSQRKAQEGHIVAGSEAHEGMTML